MTAIPQPGSNRLVSDRILEPLRQVARRQWLVLAAKGALQTLVLGLGLLLLVALVFGYFSGMPVALRVALSLLVWAGIVVGATYFLRPALHRRSLSNAAFTIEEQIPDLHERISSAVELSEEDPVFAGSRQMIRHLVAQAEEDADRVAAEAVVPAKSVTKWATFLAPVLLLWIILAVVMPPEHLLGGVYRLLMPWKNTLPAALANISITPGDVTLAEGDALNVKVKVNHLSGPDRDARKAQLVIRYDNTAQTQPLELDATGPREFSARLDDVRQSFTYMAKTDRGESHWFAATVNPRPAVAQLELKYEYPTYTQLPAKTEQSSKDGAIEALQRTVVTLTLHTTGPLDVDKSRLTVYEGDRQRTIDLQPVAGAERTYTAPITVAVSGSYSIDLANQYGLANKDNHRRPITCAYDQPPTITIKSPEPKQSVRADDEVPVGFDAADDYGLSKVKAMVQVDADVPNAYDVALPIQGVRQLAGGRYVLSVPWHLARATNEGRKAQRITYWLEATDNRDPDPQTIPTEKQVLVIERNKDKSYAEILNAKRAKDLMEAVEKAIRRLDQARGPLWGTKDVDERRAMHKEELSRATSTRDLLALTSKDLSDAAGEHLASAFGAVAQEAKDVAEGPIVQSAESTATLILSAAAADKDRQETGELAVKQLDDAKKRLEALRKKLEEQKQALETAEKLRQLALAQQDLAKQQDALQQRQEEQANADHKLTDKEKAELAKLQEERQKQREKQQALLNKLQEQINRDEKLRTPEAVEAARRLSELTQRLAEQQDRTEKLQDHTEKQQKIAELEEQADELAKQQEALNDDLKKFQEKQSEPLQEANAQTPNREHQQNIVSELNQNRPQDAAQHQKQSAEQLKNAANQLQGQAKSKDVKANAAEQKTLELARDEAQQDKALANQVAQAQQKAQEATQNAAQDPKDQNAQQAADKAQAQADAAADQLVAEAKEAQAEAAEAAKEADAAANAADKSAQAAKSDAQKQAAAAEKASADEAQQAAKASQKAADQSLEEAQAAEQAQDRAAKAQDQVQRTAQAGDQKAAQEAQQQAQKATEQAAQAAQKAGEQLAEAAERQAAAEQAAMLADQQAAAADAAEEAQALADRQQALAEAAANKAEELAAAKQDLASAQDVANQEGQLADQARQAARAAQQLAEQAKSRNPKLAERAAEAQPQIQKAAEAQAQAAKAEHRAAEAMQQAQKANEQAAQAAQQAAQKGTEAAERDQQADAAEAQARAADEQAAASNEQAAEQQALGNEGAAQGAEQQAQQAGEQAKAARQQAGQLNDQAKGSRRQAAQADRQADAAQAQARQAEARAAEGSKQAAAAQGEAAKALADAQQSLRGLEAQLADAGAKKAGGQQGEGQGEPQQSAAQAAQEAAQAQQQAVQGQEGAGREAANALAEAARAAAEAAQQGDPSQAMADGQESQSKHPGAKPGQALDSKEGISVVDGGGTADGRPENVRMLGISASDWVRLGPATQQELLNAAQQSGPPAYQEMIKNYYVRIARMNAGGAGTK